MRLLIRFLVPLAGVVLLTACGGSGASPPASAAKAASVPTATRGADTVAVTQTWQSFFSNDTPLSQKKALLENGTTTMGYAVQSFAADPRVGQAAATVQRVEFPSADQADVTYQISLNGAVVMGGMAGKAVRVGGRWLVSDATLCGLLQLAAAQGGGSTGTTPGCS
jgi:hypothetical protein